MAFRCQVLDTADLANIDPIAHAQLNIAAADKAAYFLLDEQIPRNVGDSILEH